MKIVILDGHTANPGDLSWDELKALGEVVVHPRTLPDQTIERALDADAVLTNKVVLDARIIDSLKTIKYIGVLATGTNVVDVPFASSKGIVVTNVPQYSTESVVQNAFAHILNLSSRFVDNAVAVRTGEWNNSADFSFSKGTIAELFGKTLGVVGFGTIGKRVAQVGLALGMRALVYGPRLAPGRVVNGALSTSLNELLAESDVVSLHCPLTEATRQMINEDRINSMKRGAFLINTGRGGLLDEAAVARALRSGRLGGLGADVLSSEPPTIDNPLIKAPNCFITPHNAWASLEARTRLIKTATDNLRAFIEGNPINVVK